MPRARLQRRPRSAPLFLHDARRDQLGDHAGVALVRERPAQLRSQAPSPSRAGAARSIRAPHARVVKPALSLRPQISRTNTARSGSAQVSKRGRALIVWGAHAPPRAGDRALAIKNFSSWTLSA